MATITYHHTEDSEATVSGSAHTLTVVNQGGVCEILRPIGQGTYDLIAEVPTYGEAIDRAERIADGTE